MQSLYQYRQLSREMHERFSPENESKAKVEDSDSPSGVTDPVDGVGFRADGSHIIVEWEGPTDPLNPRNWSMSWRIWIFAVVWINVFAVDWAAGADSQASDTISKVFHVSKEAETLSPAMYTFGVAIGALFAGPISETVGRNPIYIVSRCFHVVWLLGVALAPNFAAQIIFRFLAGLGGSILLAIHAASMADIFSPLHRTVAWPCIALSSFFGTAFAPVAGAWIEQSGIDWRWTEWVALILSASTLIFTLFTLPETFGPILLAWKAKHIRAVTGNKAYVSQMELQETLMIRFRNALLRASHMVTKEPIVLMLGLWLVCIYISVFGFLQGFTFIFKDNLGFSRGLTGTSFLAIAVGNILWTLTTPIYYRRYKRRILTLIRENGDIPTVDARADQEAASDDASIKSPHWCNTPSRDLPDPEYRLWLAVLAAPAFPISMFWLGWTNYSSISPWSDLGAVTLFGFCWSGIYVTVYQYILDVYGIYAGSALACITFLRYAASGIINLVSRPMYQNLGVQWTMTLLGCIATILVPVPIVFYYYGPAIRKRSHFANIYARPNNERRRSGHALRVT